MIHYLIVGHACDEEQECQEFLFDNEQPNDDLEKKFINFIRDYWGYDPDKEVYVDFILKSNSPIEIQYG